MGEALTALVTLIRLLPRMQPHVFNQVVFVFEGLGTDATLMRSLPCRETENKINTQQQLRESTDMGGQQ